MAIRHLYLIFAFFWMFTVIAARPHPKTHEEKASESRNLSIEDVYKRLLASESAQKLANRDFMEKIDTVDALLNQVEAEQFDLSSTYTETKDVFRTELEELNNRSSDLEAREIFFGDDLEKAYLDLYRTDERISISNTDDLDVYESDFKKLVDPKDYRAFGAHADETTLTEMDVYQFSLNRLSAQIKWVYEHLTERHLILG